MGNSIECVGAVKAIHQSDNVDRWKRYHRPTKSWNII